MENTTQSSPGTQKMEHAEYNHTKEHSEMNHKDSYKKLGWMMLLSFVVMYILMYAMVDQLENVIPNVNQFYMAGLMSSPMIIIEILIMGKMYPDKKLNKMLLAIGLVLLVGFWFGIRKQTGVGDVQFLKSMIPHHAGAILMVEESSLQDPEVKKLADDIIKAQNKEIEFMKRKIKELEDGR